MRALSIRQPWAWAILHADRDIENRTWRTSRRGEFFLHAATTYDTDGHWFLEREFGLKVPSIGDLPRGGIVGIARLIDCVDRHESRWFSGPYGFVLADVAPTRFFPYCGALGFFDIADAVSEMLLPTDRSARKQA